jgi:hypothetical protein
MAVSDGTMLKKHHVGLWINGGTYEVPEWVRIKKSTENTITMNAETREVDYIVDENPTTILDKYKPSLSQPIVMYKGEPDFEFVFDKFFRQSVGADAEGEVLIVFYGADGGEGRAKAWRSKCVFTIDSLNPVDSTITVGIDFAGTTEKVEVDTDLNIYELGSKDETVDQIIKVVEGTEEVEDATVEIDGVKKTTDAAGKATFKLINGKTYAVTAYKDGKIAAGFVDVLDENFSLNISLVIS